MQSLGKILLVGNSTMPRMLLGNYLEGLGYEVQHAADEFDVLGALVESDPNVVLQIMSRSKMVDVKKTLDEVSVDAPIVALTSEDVSVDAHGVGVVEVLPWPSARPEIAAAIARAVQQRRSAKLSVTSIRELIAASGDWENVEDEPQRAAQIGRYSLVELLGQGAMGDVFLCEDELMRRRVAVKTITRSLRAAEDAAGFAERFMIEEAALARLVHPLIVATYDFGVDRQRGVTYLVMEYVDGPDLWHVMNRGPVPLTNALCMGWDLADTLTYIHENHIIHRDIKPSNVLLDKLGRTRITDFGVARMGSFTVSKGQMVLGSPGYIAPEQFLQPEAVDFRADQYSLGVLLHEMVTGFRYELKGPLQVQLIAGANIERPPLDEFGLDAPRELQAILSRMMAYAPEDRYSSDEDLLDALCELGELVGLHHERAL